MKSAEATSYRRGAARLNYLAQDRPDIAVAANVLARSMARPLVGDEVRLKRVIRYLKSHPRCRLKFVYQPMPEQVRVLSDSDWAGDIVTRRSTSGMMIMFGAHLLSFASRLQKTVALSSGEAELNAQILGLAEGIGVSNLCREWGLPSELACYSDSSAARGIACRVGVGKMKHLQVKQLWIQEQVRAGRTSVSWISHNINSADALTHHCTEAQMNEHLTRFGVEVRPESFSSGRGGVLDRPPSVDWWAAPPARESWADLSEDIGA